MALPTQNVAKLIAEHSRDAPGPEYTIAHRVYDIGKASLSDMSLEPRDTLPNNAVHPSDSDFTISHARIGKVKGDTIERAIITAAKAKYKTGTISCTITQATTTVTLVTGGPFYPQIVGKTITITGETNVVVSAYTNPTTVTVSPSQTIAGATAATFPYADTELARSRSYRGRKKSYWQAWKRFHAAPADVEALVNNLWDSYFLFNTNFPSLTVPF